ncbi:hypothetical protein NQK81_01835 [Amycolatopsis roodepoortensis]|nr:hypothetical protein [Amycolatopsis roodepoortensis]UUV32215.1 hypothetical protein NQK81_01835 [Amycolatopsis roodepoortensis]
MAGDDLSGDVVEGVAGVVAGDAAAEEAFGELDEQGDQSGSTA